MALTLPDLPYAMDALQPHMSKETLEFHYGKHHKTYVDKANAALPGSGFENMEIEDIIKKASGGLFNNVAQIWNHTFFWNCLTPNAAAPGDKVTKALTEAFGGVDQFKAKFTETAVNTFGSGWAWLVRKPDGSLAVTSTSNAGNPMTDGDHPVLTCDVWEHAYYIDYRNARPKFLEAFWALANWSFVESRLG